MVKQYFVKNVKVCDKFSNFFIEETPWGWGLRFLI
jgi:hypothetical protein